MSSDRSETIEWTGKCRCCPARYSTAWELEAHEKSHMETSVTVQVQQRPADCVRPLSCCGQVIHFTGGGSGISCGLSGCKHNHNPTHGGCGTDQRSQWGHTRDER